MEKLVLLNSVQIFIEMQGWLLLTFFICLHNQLSSFNSIIVVMSEKRVHQNILDQIESKNEWLLLPVAFTAKLALIFVLTFENAFSESFHFKATRKSIGSSKKSVLGIFKIALRLRDRHVFMSQSVKVSNVFNTLTLKQIFWKTKTFFKKLEYRFLVETTKIENTSFPFKTALSEANVKTNRIATTKWTYHKEWSFASSYFISLENLFEFLNLSVRVNLMYQRSKCPYSYFS